MDASRGLCKAQFQANPWQCRRVSQVAGYSSCCNLITSGHTIVLKTTMTLEQQCTRLWRLITDVKFSCINLANLKANRFRISWGECWRFSQANNPLYDCSCDLLNVWKLQSLSLIDEFGVLGPRATEASFQNETKRVWLRPDKYATSEF